MPGLLRFLISNAHNATVFGYGESISVVRICALPPDIEMLMTDQLLHRGDVVAYA
jgi:hypothetical protein